MVEDKSVFLHVLAREDIITITTVACDSTINELFGRQNPQSYHRYISESGDRYQYAREQIFLGLFAGLDGLARFRLSKLLAGRS